MTQFLLTLILNYFFLWLEVCQIGYNCILITQFQFLWNTLVQLGVYSSFKVSFNRNLVLEREKRGHNCSTKK